MRGFTIVIIKYPDFVSWKIKVLWGVEQNAVHTYPLGKSIDTNKG